MTKREAYREGKERGEFVGLFIINEGCNDYDQYLENCHESEQNSRQYSDFSFLAHDLNNSRYPENCWAGYEEGLISGFNLSWRHSRDSL